MDDGEDVQPRGLPRFHKRESIIAAAKSIGGGVRNYRVQADIAAVRSAGAHHARGLFCALTCPAECFWRPRNDARFFVRQFPLTPPFCCSDPAQSAVVEDRTGKRSWTTRGKAAGSQLFCRSPMFNVSYSPYEGSRLWSWASRVSPAARLSPFGVLCEAPRRCIFLASPFMRPSESSGSPVFRSWFAGRKGFGSSR